MLRRGSYIGDIIDAWADVRVRAETRAKLGLTDMAVFVEDYFCEILNITQGDSLVNLNHSQTNQGGIDLADDSSKKAWQITIQKSSEKVNETLKAVKKTKYKDYKLGILIVGTKQSSYGAVDDSLAKALAFDIASDLWDLNDLAKAVVALGPDQLAQLHEYVSRETYRVAAELELPEADGSYRESFLSRIETSTSASLTGVSKMVDWQEEQGTPEEPNRHQRLLDDLKPWLKIVAELPRVSREVYAFILSCIDEDQGHEGLSSAFEVDYDILSRKSNQKSSLDSEIPILVKAGLISRPFLEDEDDRYSSAVIRVYDFGVHDTILLELLDFVNGKGLSISSMIQTLDFSPLQ